MVAEKYILVCQIAASVFMGLDYFLTEEQRSSLNQFLKKHLNHLQHSENQFLVATYQRAKNNRRILFFELIMFLGSLVTALYLIPYVAPRVHILVTLLLSFVSGLALISGLNKLFAVACYDGVPVAFSLLKVSLTRFLIRCPKGTGFGIGFLFLGVSFICRGTNINW